MPLAAIIMSVVRMCRSEEKDAASSSVGSLSLMSVTINQSLAAAAAAMVILVLAWCGHPTQISFIMIRQDYKVGWLLALSG